MLRPKKWALIPIFEWGLEKKQISSGETVECSYLGNWSIRQLDRPEALCT